LGRLTSHPMPTLLEPGKTCWRVSRAKRVSFLVDAAAYYKAFAETAERARHQIIITAWDIDGRIHLHPDRPRETFRGFLYRLLKKTPTLHIYILNWKFPLLYAADRELLPAFDAPWQKHPRLHFEWDSYHPAGACHHQKIAVIDDAIAFVGGLDFTHERWDTPRHKPWKLNRFYDGQRYQPFHDTVAMVEGPVARDIGFLARHRLKRSVVSRGRAMGGVSPVRHANIPWPSSVPVDVKETEVGVCRTEPEQDTRPQIREIEEHYLACIKAAKRFIYIENQYFTAGSIIETLRKTLREPNGPEIILIIPKGCTGWMEEVSLGAMRSQAIAHLRKQDRFRRLHVYYPFIDGLISQHYVKVHDKLMIVDDLYLHLGSANLCNRSLAVDTECDLVFEGHSHPDVRGAIKHLRERLIAEHAGGTPESVDVTFRQTGSLAETIRTLVRPERALIEFDGEVSPLAQAVGKNLVSSNFKNPHL
jgi:phospholipase D1/2